MMRTYMRIIHHSIESGWVRNTSVAIRDATGKVTGRDLYASMYHANQMLNFDANEASDHWFSTVELLKVAARRVTKREYNTLADLNDCKMLDLNTLLLIIDTAADLVTTD